MTHLYLIFDSVTNTVFHSQVFLSIQELALKSPNDRIILLSFESDPKKAADHFTSFKKIGKNFQIIIMQRLPFWGAWTLKLAANHLAEIITAKKVDSVVCRGVFAAGILYFALQKLQANLELEKVVTLDDTPIILPITCVTVLIPGIASEEIKLIDENQPIFRKWILKLKSFIFSYFAKKIERLVYSHQILSEFPGIKIRYLTSSPALQDYLATTFNHKRELFLTLDNPTFNINEEEKLKARTEIRLQLGISNETLIYCYSGGMQSWQHFDLAVTKFLEIKPSTPTPKKLLVITGEPKTALSVLQKNKVLVTDYLVISLPPTQVHQYLLACDFGLLLRRPNIVNFTARPIKALEYKQAGLSIIHNNTIDWVNKFC